VGVLRPGTLLEVEAQTCLAVEAGVAIPAHIPAPAPDCASLAPPLKPSSYVDTYWPMRRNWPDSVGIPDERPDWGQNTHVGTGGHRMQMRVTRLLSTPEEAVVDTPAPVAVGVVVSVSRSFEGNKKDDGRGKVVGRRSERDRKRECVIVVQQRDVYRRWRSLAVALDLHYTSGLLHDQ